MAQQTYFCTLTAVGEAKDANAKALGTALKFTQMAVGDGNGALPIPDRNRTALVRQVRRAPINTLKADPLNPGQVIAEQIIPEDVGGWWIRELGLYDEAGDLVAIGNCPETYKPQLAEGSGRVQIVRMVLILSSAATVQLKVDPSVVLATRKYVEEQDALHVAALDPHPQYMTAAESEAKIQAAIAGKANLAGASFSGPVGIMASVPQAALHVIGNSILTNSFDQKAFLGGLNGPNLRGVNDGENGYLSFDTGAGAAPSPYISWNIAGSRKLFLDKTGMLFIAEGGIRVFKQGAISDLAFKVDTDGSWVQKNLIGHFYENGKDGVSIRVPASLDTQNTGLKMYANGTTILNGPTSEWLRTDSGGNLLVGATAGTAHRIQKSVPEGEAVCGITGNAYGTYFYAASAGVLSSTKSALEIYKNSTTNRSINAAGTVNASGADYAEYMTKAAECGDIEAGQIAGINAAGMLVDTWADAVSFLIKSTNPSYVGGDVWGSADNLGVARPDTPILHVPEYTGSSDPGPAPVAPVEPTRPAEPVKPAPPIMPPAPVASEDVTDEEKLAYAVLHIQHRAAITQLAESYQAAVKAQADQYQLALEHYATARDVYQEQLATYRKDKAAYDTVLAAFKADQAAHAEKVESDRLYFDAIAMPAYQAELTQFEQVLEAARQRVDRMAYCGQVPVNVTGAKPGQYVVPVQDGDGIASQLVDADAITFDQYRRAVGIVQNVLEDGRANVRVKPV